MSRGHTREFGCEVVSETVLICLRRSNGFGRPQGYFVQCNQTDCQYVDENKPPCPLHCRHVRGGDQGRGGSARPPGRVGDSCRISIVPISSSFQLTPAQDEGIDSRLQIQRFWSFTDLRKWTCQSRGRGFKSRRPASKF